MGVYAPLSDDAVTDASRQPQGMSYRVDVGGYEVRLEHKDLVIRVFSSDIEKLRDKKSIEDHMNRSREDEGLNKNTRNFSICI